MGIVQTKNGPCHSTIYKVKRRQNVKQGHSVLPILAFAIYWLKKKESQYICYILNVKWFPCTCLVRILELIHSPVISHGKRALNRIQVLHAKGEQDQASDMAYTLDPSL